MEAADHVVLTCPPPVLKKLEIIPPLPSALAASLQRLDMGLMDVVLFRFKTRFWTNHCTFFGMAFDTEPAADERPIFTTFLNLSKARDDRAPLLMAQVFGSAAIRLESMTLEQIAEVAFESLGRIFPTGSALLRRRQEEGWSDQVREREEEYSLERPIGCVVHKWGMDDFAGGSWTIAGPGCTLDDLDRLSVPLCSYNSAKANSTQIEASACCLQLSGESTISEYFGTIHGAYISGQRAADHIISSH